MAGFDAAERSARSSDIAVLPGRVKDITLLRERLTDRPGRRIVTVGPGEDVDVQALGLLRSGERYRITFEQTQQRSQFELRMPGRHNALATVAPWPPRPS